LRDRIDRLEQNVRQNGQGGADAQAAAWFTQVGVQVLLEIIQRAFPDAVPMMLGYLCQQLENYPPVGEDPDPAGFN
jgi:hypothetical protein